AIYGFILTATYFAVTFKWTNEAGKLDENNRYFQDMHDKYNQGFKVDSASMVRHRQEAMSRILVLQEFYPVNAEYILSVLLKNKNEKLALRMLDAVDLRLMKNKAYRKAVLKMRAEMRENKNKANGLSAF